MGRVHLAGADHWVDFVPGVWGESDSVTGAGVAREIGLVSAGAADDFVRAGT